MMLPRDINDWPTDARDECMERAAIMEYDAHLERGWAMAEAMRATRRMFDGDLLW